MEALEKELAGVSQEPQSQTAQQELEYVKELLRQREQELFGPSSERRKDPADPSPPAKDPDKERGKRKRGHGPTPQPDLRAVDVPHELPEGERDCEKCGGQLVEMGEAVADSEEIDLVAKEFVRLIHRRKKYHCECGQTFKVAPGPVKLIPGGRYSTAFAIDVAVAKYLDAMPLARQVRSAARHGIGLTTSALWDQLGALATALYPTFLAIQAAILTSPVIGADETHRLVMANGKAEVNRKFYVWGLNDGRYAAYRILPGRSTDDARKVFGNYGGIVMTDGYEVYESLAKSGKTMRLGETPGHKGFRVVHCWMHVRRKFVEAEAAFPKQSKEALDLIRGLYLLEREAD
ncbi:MAG: transposase, partial [Cyanobacteria bacterium REEB65]|nr:transposase [Cyanobacteria bacterium REEB65]